MYTKRAHISSENTVLEQQADNKLADDDRYG